MRFAAGSCTGGVPLTHNLSAVPWREGGRSAAPTVPCGRVTTEGQLHGRSFRYVQLIVSATSLRKSIHLCPSASLHWTMQRRDHRDVLFACMFFLLLCSQEKARHTSQTTITCRRPGSMDNSSINRSASICTFRILNCSRNAAAFFLVSHLHMNERLLRALQASRLES